MLNIYEFIEKPFVLLNERWRNLGKLEHFLIVSSSILLCISLTLFILIFTSSNETLIVSSNDNEEICSTPKCINLASNLYNQLNLKADPCENFYEYACGNWKNLNPLPKTMSEWTARAKVSNKISKKLEDIILGDKEMQKHNKSFLKMQNYFVSCSNMKERNAQGLNKLVDHLNNFLAWPIITKNWSSQNFNWTDVYVKMNKEWQASYIIRISKIIKNTFIIFQVEPPSFGISMNTLTNLNEISDIKAYERYIYSSVQLLSQNFTMLNKDIVMKDIKDLIEFEKNLANLAINHQLSNNFTQVDAKFEQDVNIKIKQLIDEIYVQKEPNLKESILARNKNYFFNLKELLNKTNSRVIANYLGWRMIQLFSPSTTSEFQKVIFEFTSKTMKIYSPISYKTGCLIETKDVFNDLLGSAYIQKYYEPIRKERIHEITLQIRSIFMMAFQQSRYLRDRNNLFAEFKLSTLQDQIGQFMNFKNEKFIHDFYNSLEDIPNDNYLEAYRKVLKWVKQETSKISQFPTEFSHWDITNVIAAYYEKNNLIVIPEGIQHGIFFSKNRPEIINYATIGSAIGHEIAHAFDTKRVHLDEIGDLNEWLEGEAKIMYDRYIDCLKVQYSQYVEPITKMHINGQATLNENFADNIGIITAYFGYELSRTIEIMKLQMSGKNISTLTDTIFWKKRLGGKMSKFSSDELFFISYASTFCGNFKSKTLKIQLEKGIHSPNIFRVNGVLANFDRFAKVYNCPINSTMNPIHKCHLK